jgi:hypothetical protein
MKKIILAFIATLIVSQIIAQNLNYVNRHLNFKTVIAPQTSCFLEKGDIKLAFIKNTYLPNSDGSNFYNTQEKLEVLTVRTFGNYLLITDNRLHLSYAVSNKFSLGFGYAHSKRFTKFQFQESEEFPLTEGKSNSFELSGAYRKKIGKSFEYEIGTGLMLGKGKYKFQEPRHYILNDWNYFYWELSNINYSMFAQNFVVSAAHKRKKTIITAQLNAGYVRYFEIKSEVMPYVHNEVMENFMSHQTDFYIDPAIIINFNIKRFGIQTHLSYPYAFGESKISKSAPTIGLGFSYKIIKSKVE